MNSHILSIVNQFNQNINLGEVIRFHRQKSGLNQIELARLAGVGKTVVFDIEHNKTTIRLETLLKILRILNIHLTLDSPLMKLYEKEKDENR